MVCVFYTWSSVSNTMNYIAKEDKRISWNDLCKIAEEKELLNPKVWAYIISSPKLLLELWYINSFGRCRTLVDIKLALSHKKPVQTGTNSIDWNKTIQNKNIAVRGESYGHSFFICWYDDERQLLICENSYWKEEFANWYFFIKYEDLDLLFDSKYIMTDTPRETYDQAILDNINIDIAKEMYKMGLWNWKNAKTPMTREEVMTVLYRVMEKLESKFNLK